MNLLLSPSCSEFPPDGTCICRLCCGAPAECGRETLGVVGYIQWIRPDFLSSGNVEFRKEVRDSNIWLYCLCLKDRTACAKWNEIYQKSSGGLKRETWNQVRDPKSPLSMTSPGFWRMDQMRWAQATGEESRLRGGAAWAVRGQGAVKYEIHSVRRAVIGSQAAEVGQNCVSEDLESHRWTHSSRAHD